MAPLRATRRAGMTLVELLVVVAIVGLLAVTVLPTLATTTEGRRTRETTRTITSFVAQRQAKAFGHPTGAGFGLVKTGTGMRAAVIDLVPAVIPDAYRGDTPTAFVTLTAPSMTTLSSTLSFTPAFSSGGFVSCATGDLIRFDGRGAWYSLLGSGTPTECSLRSSTDVDALAGQTAMNTPWPAVGSSVPHSYEILRGPQRAGGAVSIGDGRCIDVYWSFAGTMRLNKELPSMPAVMYFMFDAAGRVRQYADGSARCSPNGPILLLVGRVDRAGQDWEAIDASDDTKGANWQYADSEWIAIDLMSGVTKSAPCAAGATDVTDSQAYIEAAMTMGGR